MRAGGVRLALPRRGARHTGGMLSAITSPDFPPPDADGVPHVALFMHGYGSNERDLPGLAPFLPAGTPWASLRAPLEMGFGGAAWFPLANDPGRWRDPAAILDATDAVWAWVDAEVPAETTLITVGFSQGGLMATQLLRSRPERTHRTVVLSGLMLDAPMPADASLAQSRPPVFYGRGDSDPVIPGFMEEHAEEFLRAHADLDFHVYPGLTHSVSEAEMRDVQAFLAR